MRVAALQANAAVLDVAANLRTIERAALEAAEEGASLLVTPELFVTAYAPAEIARGFDTASLPALHAELARIASDTGIGVVASLPEPIDAASIDAASIDASPIHAASDDEPASGRLGIVAVRYDARGVLRDRHVKTQLYGPDERAAFAQGHTIAEPVDAIALAICYEVEFPEYVRATARRGARLLAVPTAITPVDHRIPEVLVPARALENGVRVVYANHCGTEAGLELGGGSVIADQHGAILARAGSTPALLVADLDDAVPQADYLADRRADLYDA